MSAAATWLPKIEEKKAAFAVKGVKNAPSNRENDRIELYILSKILIIVPSSLNFSHLSTHSHLKRYSHRVSKNKA